MSRLLHIDTKVFLEGSCLAVGDRTSMAHSLEVRVPFLDRNLVEYAATIPAALKHKGATTKYILRRALAPVQRRCARAVIRIQGPGRGGCLTPAHQAIAY